MPNNKAQPRQFPGVTVSSTFTDLKEHRAALIEAINGQHFHPVVMEHDAAKVMDVIDSSLEMLQDGAAYIGIIGKKYGQVPTCAKRNPDKLSITELESNKAVELERPILLFIMGKDHLVREDDIEKTAAKKKKLKSFTERAKKMREDSSVHRIYAVFDSPEDFAKKLGPSLAALRSHLEKLNDGDTIDEEAVPGDDEPAPTPVDASSIPKPPNFYAEPDYIGSHKFVGRARGGSKISATGPNPPIRPTCCCSRPLAAMARACSHGSGRRIQNTPRRSVTIGPGGSGIRSMSGGRSWGTSASGRSPT